jgi:CubicO group peptidase (beta-lactamase class C family)
MLNNQFGRRAFLEVLGASTVAATATAAGCGENADPAFAGAQTGRERAASADSNRLEREGHSTSAGALSKARLGRMHDVMAGFVERGEVPGLVSLICRRGETHVDAIGMKALGAKDPVRRDTIFRIASMTKAITAAATMILVEECKLRLDEPVDRLLPELADRKVLQRLDGPADDTVPANRPINVRDLLTFRLGFGQAASDFAGLWENHGWGFGVAIVTKRDGVSAVPGQYGWNGGLGTSWKSDPAEDMIGILLTQRAFTSPRPPNYCLDFWTSAYQAIDD